MKSSFLIEGALVDITVFHGRSQPRWDVLVLFPQSSDGRLEQMTFTKTAYEFVAGSTKGVGLNLQDNRLVFKDPFAAFEAVETGIKVALDDRAWTGGRRMFTAGHDRHTGQLITISLFPKMAKSLLDFVRAQLAQ